MAKIVDSARRQIHPARRDQENLKLRENRLRGDPLGVVVNPRRMKCKRCGGVVKLSMKMKFDPQHWDEHRTRCDSYWLPGDDSPSSEPGTTPNPEGAPSPFTPCPKFPEYQPSAPSPVVQSDASFECSGSQTSSLPASRSSPLPFIASIPKGPTTRRTTRQSLRELSQMAAPDRGSAFTSTATGYNPFSETLPPYRASCTLPPSLPSRNRTEMYKSEEEIAIRKAPILASHSLPTHHPFNQILHHSTQDRDSSKS